MLKDCEQTPQQQEGPADGTVRIRLDLAYQGAEFSGWARQPGRRTVQGEIEDALRVVTRSEQTYDLTVAGRTDAGVHARGQVAHVDLPVELWAAHGEKLLRRLAGRLPGDVRVYRMTEAPAGFDARFAAIWRRYAYRVADHPGGVDPLLRGHVLWHDRPLDIEKMNEAAKLLLASTTSPRTARSARARPPSAPCSTCTGSGCPPTATRPGWPARWRWRRCAPTPSATTWWRALVGAMLLVGDGHRPVEFPGEVLAGGVRNSAVNVIRPYGLTLEEVGYPADDQLADRNRAARRMRTLPGLAG